MRVWQRFILATIMWIVYEVLTWVPTILGVFLVPLAILCRQVIPSPITGKPIVTAPDWLWLWGNDEDGYVDPNIAQHGPPAWVRRLIKTVSLDMWWWAAIRNPVGNLRFVESLNPPPDRTRIQFIKGDSWALTWQGWLHHLTVLKYGYEFTVGWKYYPSDKAVTDSSAYGWRRFGCGFALRLRKADAADSLDG